MGMRAVVYRGPGRLAVEEVPVPEVTEGDLLLRIRAASICATDLKIFAHGHFKIPSDEARILGHELAGEVVAGAEAYPGLERGDLVGVAPNVGCGRCEACVQGLDNLCPSYEAVGITMDGALAEFVRIPARAVRRGNVVPVSASVPPAEIALVEPMSCVLAAHEAVGTRAGDRVAVVGAGPMGLMHVLFARRIGAGCLLAIDPLPERRRMAVELGADEAVTPQEAATAAHRLTGARGFDVVIVSVPAREAQEQAVALAAVQGRIHLFAGLPKGAPPPVIDTNAIHYRQLVLTGTTGASARQYRRTVDLVASRQLVLAPLISARMGLTDAPSAFRAARAPEELKTVILPGDPA